MQKGILFFNLNKEIDAQDVFLDCMEMNYGNFDPRILKDCITQIMIIQQKKGRNDMYQKAKSLLDQFNTKNKDYIFLVNEEVKPSFRREENLIENKVQKTLQLIFDEKIESNDRISLMTF